MEIAQQIVLDSKPEMELDLRQEMELGWKPETVLDSHMDRRMIVELDFGFDLHLTVEPNSDFD